MSYYINQEIDKPFDKAVEITVQNLKDEGFGILTEIDVQATLRKKLNKDFRKYRILGACNPPYAYQALLAEDKVGTMLPCNVIVQEIDENRTEIAAVDPVASMQAIDNENLLQIAQEIRRKLKRAVKKSGGRQ